MKFLILFALVAAALGEPEADANTVFTNGVFHTNVENLQKGIHTQHAGTVGTLYNVQKPAVVYKQPVVYTKPVMPYTTYVKPAVTSYAYPTTYTYASPMLHKLFKREAEAEAEPEAYHHLPYANPWAYNAGVYNYHVPTTVYNTGVTGVKTYNTWPYTTTYGGYRLFKREAEADSEAEADPLTIYHNTPYHYNLGYKTPVYTGYTGYTGFNAPVVSSYSGLYNNYPYHHVNGYRLFKREAEAESEADPWTVYRTNPYYTGLQYASPYYNTYRTPYVTNPVSYMNTPYRYYY